MNHFLSLIAEIPHIQDNCILRWKANGLSLSTQEFIHLVEENHSYNYQLWHAEDNARRDDMGFEYVYRAKRTIDQFNQKRNNLMEAIDEYIFQTISPYLNPNSPLHSETPGMMIDRLSILALKIYHMAQQTMRKEVGEQHRQICTDKLTVLNAQRQQLSLCLSQLMDEVLAGRRSFKIYHQFKMYNDPTLNPQLYGVKG